MKEVICLDCSTILLIEGDLYIGKNVTCPECASEFEITHLSPVQLEWVLEDDYEYDDDYDDDDDMYDDDYDEEFDEEEEEMETY